MDSKLPSSGDVIWGSYDMAPVSTLRHVFRVAQGDHELVEKLDRTVQ
jgi:hypothetical protein